METTAYEPKFESNEAAEMWKRVSEFIGQHAFARNRNEPWHFTFGEPLETVEEATIRRINERLKS